MAAISRTSSRVSGSPSISLMTTPVSTGTRTLASWERIASDDETISEAR